MECTLEKVFAARLLLAVFLVVPLSVQGTPVKKRARDTAPESLLARALAPSLCSGELEQRLETPLAVAHRLEVAKMSPEALRDSEREMGKAWEAALPWLKPLLASHNVDVAALRALLVDEARLEPFEKALDEAMGAHCPCKTEQDGGGAWIVRYLGWFERASRGTP